MQRDKRLAVGPFEVGVPTGRDISDPGLRFTEGVAYFRLRKPRREDLRNACFPVHRRQRITNVIFTSSTKVIINANTIEIWN